MYAMYTDYIETVLIPSSVTEIADSCFYTSALTDVYYAGSEDEWKAITIGSDNDALNNATIHYNALLSDSGFFYSLIGDETIKVTGYIGNKTYSTIPSEIDGYIVTSIGEKLFFNRTDLTSITIPNCVTSIGDYAFQGCENLENVILSNSLTEIGDGAFANCSALKSIDLPDSVTSIGGCAFYYCSSLTSITIPSSVTSIGDYAFYKCRSLTSITIPDSVTSIGDYAFLDCYSLHKTNYTGTMDQWVEIDFGTPCYYDYGDYHFLYSCSNPTFYSGNLYINDELVTEAVLTSATKISDFAFCNCTSLTSITIPSSVTSIGDYAFAYCDSLTDVYYAGSEDEWKAITIGSDNDALNNATIHYYHNCKHKNGYSENDVTVITEPTCANNGTGSAVCKFCGETVEVTIPATGEHSYNVLVSAKEEPTCSEKGKEAVYKCMTCELTTGGDVIPATGHEFDDGTTVKAATCTEDGEIKYTCTNCGESYTDTIPASGHDYEETIVDATCTEDGYTFNKCLNCGEEYYSDIEKATGHSYVGTVIEPTCTRQGYTNYVCVNCGDTYTDDYADALGHSYDSGTVSASATCTQSGVMTYTCTRCSKSYTDTIPASGHTYCNGNITTTPTCTQNGVKTYTCTICGETKTEEIPASGHEFDDGTTVKAATCTDNGEIKYTCMRCGKSYTDTIPAIGHNYEETIVDATCTEDGYTFNKCLNCGEEYYSDIEKATGHDYVTSINHAGINENGSVITQCEECGSVQSTSTIYAIKSISLSATSYTYDGKAKTPTVTVKDSKGNTINSKYYTVSYAKGRKNVGKYSVTINFKGNYSDSKTLYFTINPKGTSVSKLTAGKKSFTVKWSKQKTQTTGYQIQYSTSSKFKNAKTVTVSKSSTTSKTIKKLKAKKKYYVRVRTYKTVGKTKYYSSWSKAKSVKTK